jgi:hypothetical protein
MLYEAENAYAMLVNGFTTTQSLGSPFDVPLRAAIARGLLPVATENTVRVASIEVTYVLS